MSRRDSGSRTHNEASFIDAIERFSLPVSIAVLLAMMIASTYLRLLSGLIYGFKYVNGDDPWIFYWLANYFYTHNLGGLSQLSHVDTFWYPWGRNFLKTEYLGIPWLSAFITKLLGKGQSFITEAEGLLPVIFSVVGIAATYMAVYGATRSKLGAISAASVYAFYPAIVLDKSFATYPGKQVSGLGIIALSLYFLAIAYTSSSRTRSIVAALVGGIIGGSLAWLWGGYEYVALILAVIILLDPFIVKPAMDRFYKHLAAAVGYLAALSTSPAVGPTYVYHSLGLALLAVLVVYFLEANVEKLHLERLHLTGTFTRKMHLWVVILGVGLLAAAAMSGIISLPSRVLLSLGIRPLTGVVPLTVQEYMPISFSEAMAEYGPVFFVTLIGLIAFIYDIVARRERLSSTDTLRVAFLVLGVLFMVASINEAYFIPSAAFFLALSAGTSIGALTSMHVSYFDKKLRRTYYKRETSALAAGVILAIVILGFAAYYIPEDYAALKLDAPAVTTGWLTALSVPTPNGTSKIIVPLNNAWLAALNYIKYNTSKNSIVVSWWDYGYWIAALGNRTTVVDGSTINGTQIGLVANAFTAPVNQSPAYLEMMRLVPNDTYLITYDVFVGIYNNETHGVMMFPYPNVYPVNPQAGVYAITYGLGDIAKSYQMLRIALRVNPYTGSPFFSNYTSATTEGNYEFYQFPAFVGGPGSNVSLTLHATIYDLMMYGISVLNKYGYFGTGAKFLINATSFTPAAVQYVDPTTGSLVPEPITPPSPLPYYQPVKVFISVPYAWSPAGSNVTYFYSVVVFLYKWAGAI